MLKIYAFFNKVRPRLKVCFAIYAVCAVSILLSTAAFAAQTETYTYNILREGKQIGAYHFEVSKDGPNMTINATMDIEAKILFLTAYKARHTRTETYQNNTLQHIESKATYNGEGYAFSYDAQTGVLIRNGEKTQLENPVVTLTPFAHSFKGQYTNLTEKGKPTLATFSDKGIVKKKAGIKLKPFRHIQMNDGTLRDLWFTPEGVLDSLSYEKDRATISFQRRN